MPLRHGPDGAEVRPGPPDVNLDRLFVRARAVECRRPLADGVAAVGFGSNETPIIRHAHLKPAIESQSDLPDCVGPRRCQPEPQQISRGQCIPEEQAVDLLTSRCRRLAVDSPGQFDLVHRPDILPLRLEAGGQWPFGSAEAPGRRRLDFEPGAGHGIHSRRDRKSARAGIDRQNSLQAELMAPLSSNRRNCNSPLVLNSHGQRLVVQPGVNLGGILGREPPFLRGVRVDKQLNG